MAILIPRSSAAASGKTDPHLYSTLHSEVVASYVQKTIIDNEKSLELVQAQIITSIWYYPPGQCSPGSPSLLVFLKHASRNSNEN